MIFSNPDGVLSYSDNYVIIERDWQRAPVDYVEIMEVSERSGGSRGQYEQVRAPSRGHHAYQRSNVETPFECWLSSGFVRQYSIILYRRYSSICRGNCPAYAYTVGQKLRC